MQLDSSATLTAESSIAFAYKFLPIPFLRQNPATLAVPHTAASLRWDYLIPI